MVEGHDYLAWLGVEVLCSASTWDWTGVLQVRRMVGMLDADGSSTISYQEFRCAHQELLMSTQRKHASNSNCLRACSAHIA